VPQDVLKVVAEYFSKVWRSRTQYARTGITLMKLHDAGDTQLDLFGSVLKSEGLKQIFKSVDEISRRYGKHVVFLALASVR